MMSEVMVSEVMVSEVMVSEVMVSEVMMSVVMILPSFLPSSSFTFLHLPSFFPSFIQPDTVLLREVSISSKVTRPSCKKEGRKEGWKEGSEGVKGRDGK
jgi:hypothetical protein